MPRKTEQLQIRIGGDQKRRLKQLAREAGMDMSSWVLAQVLPEEGERFQQLLAPVAHGRSVRFSLAELADYLRALPAGAFRRAVSQAPRTRLTPGQLNELAAQLESMSVRRGIQPPTWTRAVPVSEQPRFGSTLSSVRLHLLTRAPVAFRRRNLFMDSSFDERV